MRGSAIQQIEQEMLWAQLEEKCNNRETIVLHLFCEAQRAVVPVVPWDVGYGSARRKSFYIWRGATRRCSRRAVVPVVP